MDTNETVEVVEKGQRKFAAMAKESNPRRKMRSEECGRSGGGGQTWDIT